jgi:Ca-activated chloride channel family protein
MRFEHPLAAAVSLGIFFTAYILYNRSAGGRYLGYSEVRFFANRMPFRQMLIVHIPAIVLALISLTSFSALSRPRVTNLEKIETIVARDIVLIIDMSYSMDAFIPEPATTDPGSRHLRKQIDAAKDVAVELISARKTDRFGLMIFGDDAFGVWPMTTDHAVISTKVAMLGTEGGYGFLGATALVKAIDAGITYIEKDSDANEPILIFISDGQGLASQKDLNNLISRLRARNIHFYWIATEKTGAATLSPIGKIVNSLNFGRRFSAVSEVDIKQAIAGIDRVEKTRTVYETSRNDRDLYPQLCLLAAVMVFGAIFLEGYRL